MDIITQVNIVVFILAMWCIPWYIYNACIRKQDFNPMGTVLLKLPTCVKCAIPYMSTNPAKNHCETGDFDAWDVGHILIYLTIGLFLPNHHLLILAISIGCELFEYIVGWRARWIVDPVCNMIGYLLGTLLGTLFVVKAQWMSSPIITVFSFAALATLLFLNRPSMMPTGTSFV